MSTWLQNFYASDRIGKKAISVALVRRSVRLSVCLSVHRLHSE